MSKFFVLTLDQKQQQQKFHSFLCSNLSLNAAFSPTVTLCYGKTTAQWDSKADLESLEIGVEGSTLGIHTGSTLNVHVIQI